MGRWIELKWKRQWGGSDRIVWVNILKADAAWHKDVDCYLPGGKSEYIGGLLRKNLGKKMNMPHIGFWEGAISFTDGRHRFSWCRDHGVKYMPVTVEGRQQVALIQQLFGTSVRLCRVRHNALFPPN